MFPLLRSIILLFLLSLNVETQSLGESGDDNFFELCQENRCSTRERDGPSIRFPFRLNTQPDICGLEGFVVSCLNNKTLLHLPFSGDFYVQEISYLDRIFSIKVHNTNCPIQSVLSLNSSDSPFYSSDTYSFSRAFTIVNCTKRIEWGESEEIISPVECLSYENNFVYLSNAYASMTKLPSHCRTFRTGQILAPAYDELQQVIERLFKRQEIFLGWNQSEGCYECENSGNFCGFNNTSNATICSTPKPKSK